MAGHAESISFKKPHYHRTQFWNNFEINMIELYIVLMENRRFLLFFRFTLRSGDQNNCLPNKI